MWSSSSRLDALLICCSDRSNADRDVLWKERGKSESQSFTACPQEPLYWRQHITGDIWVYLGEQQNTEMFQALRVPSTRLIWRICDHIGWEDTHFSPFSSQPSELFDKCRLYCVPGPQGSWWTPITSLLCLSWPMVPEWIPGHPTGKSESIQLVSPRASVTSILRCQNSGSSQETPLQGQLRELEAALSVRAHPYGRKAHYSTCCKVQDASAISHYYYPWVMPMSSPRAVAVQQCEHSHCIFHLCDVHDHSASIGENSP